MDSITACDRKFIKSSTVQPKPRLLLLKDYLKDDLSSCSSNGFKSFPRRQCCTTVRFLLEIDLKAIDSNNNNTKRLLRRSRSRAASTTISALQRASEAVINAVKRMPFPSGKSPSARKVLLPRSHSRKLLKKSFWKKADKEDEPEIVRWKSFREFLEEKEAPSDQNTHPFTTVSSNSNNNISWLASEFTANVLQSSSGNSESSCENEGAEGKNDLPEKKKVNERAGETVGEESIETATTTTTSSEESIKEWGNEKEQFSPVSVLDCPFEDDQEEISSPFQCSLARIEGTKQKLMQKIRRFESLAQLEPVDLERRIGLSDLEDEALESPCSTSVSTILSNKEENNKTEEKAQELLKLIKMKNSSSTTFILMADNLLLDFFMERIEDNSWIASALTGPDEMEHHDVTTLEVLKIAEDWIIGKAEELLLGWEVEEGRKGYVRDMERNGMWKMLEEKEEVALELEVEVLAALVEEELLFDLLLM